MPCFSWGFAYPWPSTGCTLGCSGSLMPQIVGLSFKALLKWFWSTFPIYSPGDPSWYMPWFSRQPVKLGPCLVHHLPCTEWSPSKCVSLQPLLTGQLNLPGCHTGNGQQVAPRCLLEQPGRSVVDSGLAIAVCDNPSLWATSHYSHLSSALPGHPFSLPGVE